MARRYQRITLKKRSRPLGCYREGRDTNEGGAPRAPSQGTPRAAAGNPQPLSLRPALEAQPPPRSEAALHPFAPERSLASSRAHLKNVGMAQSKLRIIQNLHYCVKADPRQRQKMREAPVSEHKAFPVTPFYCTRTAEAAHGNGERSRTVPQSSASVTHTPQNATPRGWERRWKHKGIQQATQPGASKASKKTRTWAQVNEPSLRLLNSSPSDSRAWKN